MKYCKKCLQPDTRPGISFDDNQICYACLYEVSKASIDWNKRMEELINIAETVKENARSSGSPYDCVIGVSGGKDSTFQAIYAKEKLGLKVLLVNNEPDGITPVGSHNIENLINKGFDIIKVRPNPRLIKKLVLASFVKYGNPIKPTEYVLWASAYLIADKFNIPLIIQGENAALTLGVNLNELGDGDDALRVTGQNTLQSDLKDLLAEEEFENRDLFLYEFPNTKVLTEKGIRAIWLNYYAKQWSQVYNADFAIARGLKGRTEESLYDIGRYRRYSALDSDMQMVNQMIKYLKFGFGFATDEACYDIREGRLSREDAKWLIKEYDGLCGIQYIESFCEYLNISLDFFWETVDRFVNKDLFYKDNYGVWKPKFEVGVDFNF